MINSICLLVICVVIAVQTQGDRHTMPILIFSGSRGVYSIHLSGGNITNELPKGSLTQPFGLTYDSDDRIIYVIDSSTIKSFRLGDPGSLNVVVILIEGYYSSIAIDEIREQLFVCEDVTDIIYRVWKNGTGLEEWLQVSAANDMVVDSQQGWLYWTELNAKRVMRVPVTDPTGVEVVISNADFPYGIHIDTNTNRLYWSGYASDTIEEALLDGGNRTLVAEVPAVFMFHMTGLNGHLYLAAYNDSKGCVYDVYNGSYSTLGAYEDIQPKGIVLIRDVEIVATTSTMVQQDTSTSHTVEPSATTTESTSNTVQLDTATATMGRPKDLSSSFTIRTTNSNGLTDTTTPQTSTSQAEDTILPDPQPLGWIIGGVVITLVICATIIAALIILTKRTRRTANNSDTATKTSLPAETESDKLPEEPPHTYAHFNDPEYETINQTQEDRNETEPTESKADISYALRHDPHYNNVEDSKGPVSKSYESMTEGESNVYIGPYSTPTYNTTYANTSQGDQNTYAAPFMAINTDTAYESTAQGERNTYMAPYTSINTAHQSP